MASPVDADRATSTSGETAEDTPITVTLAPNIVSGNLLVMFIGLNNRGFDPLPPTGWNTVFVPAVPGDHDLAWQYVFTRAADGSEGATVDWALNGVGGSCRWAAVCWRITGAATSGTIVEISSEVTADSINLQPVTLVPSGGNDDYLFLILGVHIGAITSQPSGPPSVGTYGNAAIIGSGGTGTTSSKVNVAGCSRQLTTASETSPFWEISSRELNGTLLLAVYPGEPLQPTQVLSMQSHVFGHNMW